jgi:hypothetical protein
MIARQHALAPATTKQPSGEFASVDPVGKAHGRRSLVVMEDEPPAKRSSRSDDNARKPKGVRAMLSNHSFTRVDVDLSKQTSRDTTSERCSEMLDEEQRAERERRRKARTERWTKGKMTLTAEFRDVTKDR